MSLFTWRNRTSNFSGRAPSPRRRAARRFHPRLEMLEDRALLTAYTAATAADLIADINAANKHGGTNTITLSAPTTSPYVLTAVNNTTNGANGLPVISGNKIDNLTIFGNSDTIERSTASGTPDFRLFDVASGSSLTLELVTLENGVAQGSGAAADGGAIYNNGTLILSGATVAGNTAQGADGKSVKGGSPGSDAAGGGIWSNGSLTLENAVISANLAAGGDAGVKMSGAAPGGNAFGGGIDVAGGTANITGTTFGFYLDPGTGSILGSGNAAQGGIGVNDSGGSAYGGAVYVAGGTVTMNSDETVPLIVGGFYNAGTENVATGGIGGGFGPHGIGYAGFLYVAGGSVTLTNDMVVENLAGDFEDFIGLTNGYGGGIFIAPGATVYLDSFTVASTFSNEDSSSYSGGSTANIDGTYTLLT